MVSTRHDDRRGSSSSPSAGTCTRTRPIDTFWSAGRRHRAMAGGSARGVHVRLTHWPTSLPPRLVRPRPTSPPGSRIARRARGDARRRHLRRG
ncbi:hypothetical protein HBB16_20355 [Pseudonocardia sp. MCCB 268]|nr:hypothetical protein [Pseudonocardia cytotoxica]